MDPGTASCAAILIYIRGPNPSLNQGTTGICYLNDKRPRRDWEKRSRIEGGQTNSDFNPGKHTRPRAVTVMNKGSSAGPKRHRSRGSEPTSPTMNFTSLLSSSLPSIRPSQAAALSLVPNKLHSLNLEKQENNYFGKSKRLPRGVIEHDVC